MHGVVELATFYTRVRQFVLVCLLALRTMPYRTDNDDDGETAAGGRLAHLLQILVRLLRVVMGPYIAHHTTQEVENVRYLFRWRWRNMYLVGSRYAVSWQLSDTSATTAIRRGEQSRS